MNRTQFAYNHSAEAYENRFAPYVPYLNQIDSFSAGLKENSSILDMGCGPGINARRFVDQGHRVKGIDLSDSMITLAKKNCPGAEFLQASVTDFVTEETFDALCLSFIIVHLEDKETERLLSGLKKLCRPDAFLFLSFMTGKQAGFENTSFSEFEIFFNYYNPDLLVDRMKKAGFKMISRKSEPYTEEDGSITEDVFLIFRLEMGGEGDSCSTDT